MVELHVNYGALEEMANTLQTARNQLATHIENLGTAMAPALAVWEGLDRDAYDPRQSTLVGTSADMEIHLTNLKTAVIQAKEGYQANEQQGVSMLG